MLWFKVYSELKQNGPMTKKEVLRALGKKETSYSDMFAEMTARGIIAVDKSKRGALKAVPEDQWDLEARSWHELGEEGHIRDYYKPYFDYDETKNSYKMKPEYRDILGSINFKAKKYPMPSVK